ECGFLLIPNVRRTWAPRGHTPIIRHRYRRDKVSAISAVTVSARRRRCGLYIHFPERRVPIRPLPTAGGRLAAARGHGQVHSARRAVLRLLRTPGGLSRGREPAAPRRRLCVQR